MVFLSLLALFVKIIIFLMCNPSSIYSCGISGGKERYIGRICASLFGVGAPEALVIGVVALLVFGPKGLAEVWMQYFSPFSYFELVNPV